MRLLTFGITVLLAGQAATAGEPGGICAKPAGPAVPPDGSMGVTISPPLIGRAPESDGWAGATFQVVVSNLAPGDEIVAFDNTEIGVGSGETGRRNPFAVPTMLASSPSGQLTVFVENEGTQRRIAGANATSMLTNLDFGIRIAQAPRDIAGLEFDGSNQPPIFQFKLQIGSVPGPRDIFINVPHESILESAFSYYLNTSGSEVGFAMITPADQTTVVLHVVECPSDFNADDGVDFFDYLDFVDAFSMGDDIADFNNDGTLDFVDYLDFAMQFSSGC